MKEKEIMELITSEYSWEQILYKIVGWEGLDPWNLDIRALSGSFMEYITKMDELDFKVPAKYIIIATVLLRMKSDHLDFLDILKEPDVMEEGEVVEIDNGITELNNGILEINPITVPPKRQPTRNIVMGELISALRKALRTEDRRVRRGLKHREQIRVKDDNITHRINELYMRINQILAEMKGGKVTFSSLVKGRSRDSIINTFLPLIFLDNERRVDCTQENIFDEIFIKKVGTNK